MAKRKIKPTDLAVQQFIRDNPEEVIKLNDKPPLLSQLFPGDNNAIIRQQIVSNGIFHAGKVDVKVITKPVGDDHEVIAIASAVSRDPGLSQDYVDTIQDFLGSSAGKPQEQKIKQLWQIYYNEGIINNAINKIAAILSGGGSYKVRRTKKGRYTKALDDLKAILHEFTVNLNDNGVDGVITGSKGVQAVTHQAVRQALVEGDYFGRQVWVKHEVPGIGTASMPMNIQSISSANMEPVKDLISAASGAELYYWKPSQDLINIIRRPPTKEIRDFIKKFIPKDISGTLLKDNKVLFDPAFLCHIKHRGQDNFSFGESLITAAIQAIAYKRAIDNLDFVTMQNLINRLTIIMVGSNEPDSPYFKQDVAMARASLMRQFFEEPGPNMTIVWAGQDIKVEDVGAFDGVLELDTRHKIGLDKVKSAIGLPEALLSGATTDGKAAGWAANLGTSSQLLELQNAFAKMWTTVGNRIALENGFTDTELVFEFDNSLLVDKVEEQNQTRQDYMAGVLTIQDLLLSRGRDPDAQFLRMCFEKKLDPETTSWQDAFMPPQGLQGQAAGAPGLGRTPDSELGKPTTQSPEKKTTVENK